MRSHIEDYSYDSVLDLDQIGVGAPEIVAYARARLARAEIKKLLHGLESVLRGVSGRDEENSNDGLGA